MTAAIPGDLPGLSDAQGLASYEPVELGREHRLITSSPEKWVGAPREFDGFQQATFTFGWYVIRRHRTSMLSQKKIAHGRRS